MGMETAKNLALAGPAAITLHDEGEASIVDLGANFFLKPAAVGTRRAAAREAPARQSALAAATGPTGCRPA